MERRVGREKNVKGGKDDGETDLITTAAGNGAQGRLPRSECGVEVGFGG